MLSTACGLGASANERTILVDFSHDEFSSAMFANFPAQVKVPQGATVVFKQTWTGEPHTVTGGKIVDEMMSTGAPWMNFFNNFDKLAASEDDFIDPENPEGTIGESFDKIAGAKDREASKKTLDAYDELVEREGLPDREKNADESFESLVQEVDEKSNEFFESVDAPWALDETEDGDGFITQNAGQPCYLRTGRPPKDPNTPCKDAQQEQPEFDGKQSYYNSGIIPYEGAQGNTFRVQLSDDIEPGSYFFYCAVHGPGQNTEVKVVGAGEDVPSQGAVSREARKEITEFSDPMLEAFRDGRDGELDMEGEKVEGPFAGLSVPTHGSINEFLPKRIETEVGEEVTWKIMGADHTVTFDVPPYFPIVRFAKNGKIDLNPKLQKAAGGSPDLGELEEPEEGEIFRVDGGTYDGTGFFSSGLFGGEPYAEYTLRFAEPGTYKYACLLHPPMVGTVVVS
jgi:plastocyanin